MVETKPTKHNFTLGQDEYEYLCWRSSEEMRTVNNSLRISLRELYNINKHKITAWKVRTGKPVSGDDEVDMGIAAAEEMDP